MNIPVFFSNIKRFFEESTQATPPVRSSSATRPKNNQVSFANKASTNRAQTKTAPSKRTVTTHRVATCKDPYEDTNVTDHFGTPQKLSVKIARGGEGTVYALADHPSIVAKIYHHDIASDRLQKLERKIEDMVKNTTLKGNSQLAWPLMSIFDNNGKWIGYAMEKKTGISIRELLANPRNLAELAPHWHRQYLVKLCLGLITGIESLAQNKCLPVDFNPSNFLVNLDTAEVSFIDCDGFQYQGESSIHLSQAYLPELAAPEVVRNQSWQNNPVKPAGLKFSIGMILYYILNVGDSPYRHKNGKDPVQNLLDGHCALGKGNDVHFPKGKCFNIWSHLIFDLKSLFISCFKDGHAEHGQRPAIQQWKEALMKYNHCIKIGHTQASIIPVKAKSSQKIQ